MPNRPVHNAANIVLSTCLLPLNYYFPVTTLMQAGIYLNFFGLSPDLDIVARGRFKWILQVYTKYIPHRYGMWHVNWGKFTIMDFPKLFLMSHLHVFGTLGRTVFIFPVYLLPPKWWSLIILGLILADSLHILLDYLGSKNV